MTTAQALSLLQANTRAASATGILTGQDRAIFGPDFKAHQIRSNGIHRVRESAVAPRTIAFHEGRMVRLLLDMRTDDLVHPVREPCENVRGGQCIDHFRQSVLPDPPALVAI